MQLPGPVRAAVGLLANAADEAKHLPDRAIELPMLAISTAMQVSLRAQQRYAQLAARGDEVLNRRPPTDEPPPWATFDEPVSLAEVAADEPAPSPARRTTPRKPAAKKAPARKAAAKNTEKSVNKPRHTSPSAFDAVDDE